VKSLTEECSNKKVSVDSLKQRLNVAVKEKSQYEQMYQKTKEELEKKVWSERPELDLNEMMQFLSLMLSPFLPTSI
jgi:predicted nuclease with TOPRIM domain